MDVWIEIGKWVLIAVGTLTVFGVLTVAVLAWLLNHSE